MYLTLGCIHDKEFISSKLKKVLFPSIKIEGPKSTELRFEELQRLRIVPEDLVRVEGKAGRTFYKLRDPEKRKKIRRLTREIFKKDIFVGVDWSDRGLGGNFGIPIGVYPYLLFLMALSLSSEDLSRIVILKTDIKDAFTSIKPYYIDKLIEEYASKYLKEVLKSLTVESRVPVGLPSSPYVFSLVYESVVSGYKFHKGLYAAPPDMSALKQAYNKIRFRHNKNIEKDYSGETPRVIMSYPIQDKLTKPSRPDDKPQEFYMCNYMDDIFIVSDRLTAYEVYRKLSVEFKKAGMSLNRKKTRIYTLKGGVPVLGFNLLLDKEGEARVTLGKRILRRMKKYPEKAPYIRAAMLGVPPK